MIVVGNGPSVLDKPLGKAVDAHKQIVRLNKFRIIPDFTGRVTTHWAFPATLWGQMNSLHTGIPYRLLTQDRRPRMPKPPPEAEALNWVPWEITEGLMEQYNIWPTTGLVVIAHLVASRSPEKIWIHGFDTLFKDFRSSQYMDPKAQMFHTHSPKAEHRILHQWLDQGLIDTLDPEHRDALYSPRKRQEP